MTPERRRAAGHVYASVVLPRIRALRYVTPLREGGSLPGIVEADDDGTYVLKFRGAGQGPKVLVAEIVVGELARALGIRVPDLRVVDLDAQIARYEADEEVQDLLTASVGLNLGIDFLPGSFGYDGSRPPSPEEASRILWLDAFTANVDRTWSNPNLLVWHGRTWAIDHGAALYFQHSWPRSGSTPERFAAQPFDASTHVPAATSPTTCRPPTPSWRRRSTADLLGDVLSLVPDEWLEPAPGMEDPGVGARGVRGEPAGPAGRPAGVAARRPRRAAGDERPAGRLPVRRPALRARGWTATSSSTSAWCSTARRPTSCDAAFAIDRDRLSALAPDLDLAAVRGVPARHRGGVPGRTARPGLPVLPRHGAALRLDQRPAQHRDPAGAGARRPDRRPRDHAPGALLGRLVG